MEGPLFLFSVNKLISNYTHIGFKQHLTHNYFRKTLVGRYSGISIIDPAQTLLHLRIVSRVFTDLIISHQHTCFVAYNITKRLQRLLCLYGHFFMYNYWPAGLITNFKRVYKKKKAKTHGHFKTIPAAFLLFDLPPQKSLDIVDEAQKYHIPVFTFLDSNVDLSLYPYWVPANLKSGFSRTLLLCYIAALYTRTFLVKKHLFYLEALVILEEVIEDLYKKKLLLQEIEELKAKRKRILAKKAARRRAEKRAARAKRNRQKLKSKNARQK